MNNIDYYGLKSPQKSRSGWLIVFGVLEAFLAFVCVLIAIAIMAARSDSHTTAQVPTKGLAMIATMYGVVGLTFVAGSVGTLMRSNWGRLVMVFLSVCWLGIGVLSLVSFLGAAVFMQTGLRGNSAGLQMVVVMIGLFMVITPGIFLRFYTLPSVKAAFQLPLRPPAPRLPVSIWIAAGLIIFGAVTMWATSQFLPLFTFFGLIFTGKVGRELMLLRAACDAVLCAFFLKRDLRSWRAMVWITVVSGASNLVTNVIRTPQQIYAHASWAHPERMNPSSFWFSNTYRLGGTFVLTLAFLLLLLYARRHFQLDDAEPVKQCSASAAAS